MAVQVSIDPPHFCLPIERRGDAERYLYRFARVAGKWLSLCRIKCIRVNGTPCVELTFNELSQDQVNRRASVWKYEEADFDDLLVGAFNPT